MKRVVALVALAACAAWHGAGQQPSPKTAAAPPAAAPRSDVLDARQLLADARTLSSDEMQGREAGRPGGERARLYLAERFKEAGLKPFGVSYFQTFGFQPRGEARPREGANVVGYLTGTSRPDTCIVVSAHYDHLGVRDGQVFNGADDNASGVAALLAMAAHFAKRPPKHSVVFVAFDAEETGMGGSRKFVAEPPAGIKRIALNVNLDMIGRSERGELYAAGAYHYPQLRPLVGRVAERAPVKLLQGHDDPKLGANDWTFQSDHGAFHRAKIPFLYFGVEDHRDYHRPTDDFENLNHEFFVRAAETVLAAVALLDSELPAPPAATRPAAAAAGDQTPPRFAQFDGMRVHYEDAGGRGEEALVFVHGWTCDATFWRLQAPAFAARARVIAVDLPGHGLSDKPAGRAYTMQSFARAVEAVLRDAEVKRAVLVGHSMGTPVVREFYRLFPERTRALVFVDGAIRGLAPKQVMEQMFAPLRTEKYRATMEAMAGGMLGRSMPADLRDDLRARMAGTPQHVALAAGEGMTDEALWKTDPVRVPVLAVFAKSPFWPADNEQFYRSVIADLDYQMWDGVGHFLMLERPQRFNETLAAFLARVKFPPKN